MKNILARFMGNINKNVQVNIVKIHFNNILRQYFKTFCQLRTNVLNVRVDIAQILPKC